MKDSINNTQIFINGGAGQFTVFIVPNDTTNLSGIYYHEAKVIDSQGNVSTVFSGKMVITKSSF